MVQYFESSLKDADALIIGGGNLISDVLLNFPLKINALSQAAARLRVSTAIYAVGISSKWSAPGRRIMRRAIELAAPVVVTARDESSIRNGQQLFFGDLGAIDLVWDPGVLASNVYPQPQTYTQRARAIVGLGCISPTSVKLDGNVIGLKSLKRDDYVAVARELIAAGFDVTLFTNGAPEDEAFLAEIRAIFALGPDLRVRIADRPMVPADLARTVASCDVLVASRLHALIVGHSYAVPTVALEWDPKVRAFMDRIGRTGYCLSSGDQGATRIVDFVSAAHAEGVAAEEVQRIKNEALREVARLVSALGGARATVSPVSTDQPLAGYALYSNTASGMQTKQGSKQ